MKNCLEMKKFSLYFLDLRTFIVFFFFNSNTVLEFHNWANMHFEFDLYKGKQLIWLPRTIV